MSSVSIIVSIVGVLIFLGGLGNILFWAIKDREESFHGLWLVPILLGALLVGGSCIYTQDPGDVKVLRNLGGEIATYSAEPGFHIKAPWQSIITYDLRNNVVSFIGKGEEDYFGGSASGPNVRINDKGGASANLDIQVNYSLDPKTAVSIYENYGTQQNFVRAIVAVDVRSIPREVAGQFETIDLLTNRGEFTKAVEDRLTKKWEDYGLIIEQVSIQDVRYSKDIVEKYGEAQKVEIERETAIHEQEVAKVKAETKKINAKATADANAILDKSLTGEVLTQQYYDTLASIGKNGNLVVVPEGSQPLVNTNK